ncbi:hypothetical protein ES704_01951 [subsurface metagenome]|jgi:uncharacterized phage protein (TIGR01671 family)
MREIKFRYIFEDKEGKKHTLTESIEELETHTDIPLNITLGWKLIARDEYTGLKDKNSKEIYKGDIVRHYDSFPSEQNQQVVWHEHGFYFAWKDGLINHRLMSTEFFEVIGNIYENPELLEGK